MGSQSKEYIELEKETIDSPRIVVALVSSAAVGGIKTVYFNYFADSTEFSILLHIIEIVKAPKQRSLFERLIGI